MRDRSGASLFEGPDHLAVRPSVHDGLTGRPGFLTGRPEAGC